MHFLPADSSVDASTSLFVPNSFLIFRLVFFALLGNLSLLQLIFASWNINASLSMTRSSPSTAIFIIFGSCMLLFSLVLALADFVWCRGRKLLIWLECFGFGIMSFYQFGTAIGTTVTEAGMACHTSLEWNVCASSFLLVPSTWLSSILFLAYFLALLMATMAHKHLYSDIWRRSIYEIVWFGQPHKVSLKDNDTGSLKVDNYEDIEKSSAQKQPSLISPPLEHTPPKATKSVRRGIDAPFQKPSNTGSNSSSRMASTITLPSFPDKSAKSEIGSKFVETFRESALSVNRSESFAHFVANQVPKDPFPFPLDIDAPIPLPRRSEWVGADDALKGIIVHKRSSY